MPQQVLALASKEAERFNHNYVGTEHLLLGLMKLGQGVAVNVLQKMGLDLERVRMEVGEACRSACRDKDDWGHSVHAPSQKGIGISRQRGPSAKSFLR